MHTTLLLCAGVARAVTKILVIKLGALGDVVMATPLLDAISAHHPDAALHLLTTPAFDRLFARWPQYTVSSFPRSGWRTNVAVIRWLRQQRFTRIYDLQANDRTGLWCALSGAPERVGNHNRYPYTHHPTSAWRGQSHIFDRMRAVLASAGIMAIAARPQLPCSPIERARVAEWLREKGAHGQRLVALHAGASPRWPQKVWPYFAQLAGRLRAQGFVVVWLGAAADRARNSALVTTGDIDATGAFSIVELAECGRHARFAVTNDSGPMHVLSAAGIPLYGLFGPSDWRRNHALGQGGRALACVDFDPRFRARACGDCLAAISVDVLWLRLVADGMLGR